MSTLLLSVYDPEARRFDLPLSVVDELNPWAVDAYREELGRWSIFPIWGASISPTLLWQPGSARGTLPAPFWTGSGPEAHVWQPRPDVCTTPYRLALDEIPPNQTRRTLKLSKRPKAFRLTRWRVLSRVGYRLDARSIYEGGLDPSEGLHDDLRKLLSKHGLANEYQLDPNMQFLLPARLDTAVIKRIDALIRSAIISRHADPQKFRGIYVRDVAESGPTYLLDETTPTRSYQVGYVVDDGEGSSYIQNRKTVTVVRVPGGDWVLSGDLEAV